MPSWLRFDIHGRAARRAVCRGIRDTPKPGVYHLYTTFRVLANPRRYFISLCERRQGQNEVFFLIQIQVTNNALASWRFDMNRSFHGLQTR